MGILPAILYVIIGGALSDTAKTVRKFEFQSKTYFKSYFLFYKNQYGKKKPLILLALLGAFVTNMAYVLISLFGEALPIEIFFLTKMWDFCGGMPLNYLGVCSYAASNSKKDNRYEFREAKSRCDTNLVVFPTSFRSTKLD